MAQIYEMFRGKLSPQAVVSAAGDQLASQFYAQLYLGLYFEALGNERGAGEHIEAAASDRFSSAGGFMHTVAKVHLSMIRRHK
jgi:lipoprotein NlpI